VKKVFIVGLDGVGFELITPWVESGKLPHIGSLLSQGAQGPLQSTVPPITGPAWTSFQTGVNPGKHGVSGWTKRRKESYAISVVNGDDNPYPTIWELASENGHSVVSIGLPVTYPPRPVNGVIIPGLLTPRSDPSPTYPAQATAELRRAVPDYQFFPECVHRFTLSAKVKELLTSARGRAAAAKHFLQHHDWDLFMVQFQVTDKVQHDLWGVRKGGFDPVLTVFREVDRQLGELVEMARGMGASVILLSDHGMGPQEYTFSINTWLWGAGYLRLKGGPSVRLKRAAFRGGFTQKNLMRLGLLLYPLAYRLGLVSSFFDALGEGWLARVISMLFLSFDDIDWSKTQVYSRSEIGHLFLNLRGREPQGIVNEDEADRLIDELIDRLKTVVNPYTSEPLLGEVFRREEVYQGERISQAPDILFLPRGLRTLGSGASGFYSKELFDRPLSRANHRMEGILIAAGDPFAPDYQIQGATLTDLAANILYLLDCPIPTYMDGRIWEEAFLPGTMAAQAPRWSDRSAARGAEAPPSGEENDEELKRRLKELGYLN